MSSQVEVRLASADLYRRLSSMDRRLEELNSAHNEARQESREIVALFMKEFTDLRALITNGSKNKA
jgi:hypothetical protein